MLILSRRIVRVWRLKCYTPYTNERCCANKIVKKKKVHKPNRKNLVLVFKRCNDSSFRNFSFFAVHDISLPDTLLRIDFSQVSEKITSN